MNEEYAKYDSMTLVELAAQLKRVRGLLDEAKAVKSALEKEHDFLRVNKIPELMDDEGVSSMNIDDIGRLGVTGDLYVSCPAGNRDTFFKWLRDNGHGDAIKETVNSSTLKAMMKAIIKDPEAKQPPEGLLKIVPVSRASITKT